MWSQSSEKGKGKIWFVLLPLPAYQARSIWDSDHWITGYSLHRIRAHLSANLGEVKREKGEKEDTWLRPRIRTHASWYHDRPRSGTWLHFATVAARIRKTSSIHILSHLYFDKGKINRKKDRHRRQNHRGRSKTKGKYVKLHVLSTVLRA